MFDDRIGIEVVANNGRWYDFGFVAGVSIFFPAEPGAPRPPPGNGGTGDRVCREGHQARPGSGYVRPPLEWSSYVPDHVASLMSDSGNGSTEV